MQSPSEALFSLVLQSLLYDLYDSHVDLVETTLGTTAWRNICLSQSHVPHKETSARPSRFHEGSESNKDFCLSHSSSD